MDDFKTQLQLLTDIILKKRTALEQILSITENQEVLLRAADFDGTEMFWTMNEEKQKLIEEVINADNFFERTFDELKDFDTSARAFPEIVRGLQDLVRDVTDFDVKIRLQEQKNRGYAYRSNPHREINTGNEASKDYILKQYQKNTKKEE